MAIVWPLLSFFAFTHYLVLLFQHIASGLGIIEDILFAVDSLVLLGFDMATNVFVLLNVLSPYICMCIVFFTISDVMLQLALLHVCMYVIIGDRAVQHSREALLLLLFLLLLLLLLLLFFHVERVALSCAFFLTVDGYFVAVDSAT